LGLQIRAARTQQDITAAIAVDEAVIGSSERGAYIARLAASGGLSIADVQNVVRAFCILDHHYFYEKPFISLLIVHPDAQRAGLGQGLLRAQMHRAPAELWTSTNRSNGAMRGLLAKSGWSQCGEIVGLDPGDPELVYRAGPA
jgi:GNAT superfamily N-acetyltransferase